MPSSLPFDDEKPVETVLSVSELTAGIKHVLDHTFTSLAVEGEISNCRRWSSGHIYFTLKDDRAQIRAVMFRTTARLLKFDPEDGLHVVLRGRVSVYDAKGEYQFVCDSMEPHGLGALQAAFEQIKARLEADGLFAQARKRPLPVLPRRIGVVTSLDGAAVRDIVRILVTRHTTARILVRGARVQGEGAADDLVRGLSAIAKVSDVDVIILARGGGSAEDLWAFNDERLARAIAACRVPVISAIGHEVDFTIADFVADVRAATPSNAAELVVDRTDVFRTRIARAAHRLRSVMELRVTRARQRLDRLRSQRDHWHVALVMRERDCRDLGLRARRAAQSRLATLRQRFTFLQKRLERRDARVLLQTWRTRLMTSHVELHALATRRRLAAASRTATLTARLDALSPLAVLGRGYAVCWNEGRTGIIRSSRAVSAGDRVRVTLADGEIGCRVE